MNKKVVWILAAVALLSGCGPKKVSYIKQADVLLEESQYAEALEQYNKAIMEDESLQQAYRGAGIASLMLVDYEKAEDYFLRALSESQGTVGKLEMDVSYYLAETQVRQGKYEQALETYTNILEYDKKQTNAYFYRGIAYARLKEMEKAEKDFDEGIASDKNNISLYYQCYEAFMQEGYEDDGKAYLTKALECKTDTKEAVYMRGKVYAALGDLTKAMEELEESRKAGYAAAVFYMGVLFEKQGEYEAAISYYTEYEKLVNVSVEEYKAIAECKMKTGDFEGALEIYQRAMNQAGETQKQDLLFGEIVLYEKSGDLETAKEKMEGYLSQYPEDETAIRENEFLNTR